MLVSQGGRVLRTVPLLAACLPQGKCNIIVGRRFSEDRYMLVLSPPSFIQKIKNCYTTFDNEISALVLSILSPLFPSIVFSFRYPELAAVCRDRRTLILYPGPKSENLEELVQQNEIGTEKHNVIIIDGTWSQAKNMFLKNSLFHLPKQVNSYIGICLEKEVVNKIQGVNQAQSDSSQM